MRLTLKRKIDKYLGYAGLILLIPFARFFGLVLGRDHSKKNPPQTIVVLKLLGLGSLFVAMNYMKSLKAKFPGAKLILITDENIAEGVKPLQFFDEVWAIRGNNLALLILDSVKHLLRIWNKRYVWLLDLEVYSKLTTLYSLLTLSINRYGFYLRPVFFRKYLNTHNIQFNQFTSLEDNYCRMFETVVNDSLNEADISEYKNKNEKFPKRYIAVNNTCSDLSVERKLPQETFRKLCSELLRVTSHDILLLGSPADAAYNEQFIRRFFSFEMQRINSVAGKLDFNKYYDILKKECVCVITIDSAPLHIAKYFGIPTFSIWGPTDPLHYLKIRRDEQHFHRYYYLNESCSPCVHHFDKSPCGGNNICMKNIIVDDLLFDVRSYLGALELEPMGNARKV